MPPPPCIIAPSLLSGDFARLGEEADRMIACGADWLHVDVMDGHFVENLTIGAPVVKSLRKHTEAFLDCHLMVSNPEKWVDDFQKAGASGYTFHIEATDEPEQLAERIREAGMRVGVAVRPRTSIDLVYRLVDRGLVDMVLVMTVEPGFGGQAFMVDMMDKVRELRSRYRSLYIQVDGGINTETIKLAAEAGANVVVAGNAIFMAADPARVISAMRTELSTILH